MASHDDLSGPPGWAVPGAPAPPGPSGPPQWAAGVPLGGFPAPPTEPTPAARLPMRLGAILAILGALVAAIGTFVPWVRADIGGVGVRTGTGWNTVQDNLGDGPILVGLAALAALSGLVLLFRSRPRWVALAGAGLGLGLTGVAIFEIVDISRPGAGVTATHQLGVWLVLAGGIAVVIGQLVAFGASGRE